MVGKEGIVIKNYGRMNQWGRQLFAKIVREDFKETNRAVFGSVKQDTSDTKKIAEAYATEARIRKRALSLINEGGHKLDRGLMRFLPVAVVQDIFKEETDEICKQFKNINLPTLKQSVAKKCLNIIDKMMVEAMPKDEVEE